MQVWGGFLEALLKKPFLESSAFERNCSLSRIKGPPPAIPYIFKFQNGSLHLCGPADNRMHRATNFDGPGLCVMDKIETMSASTMPRQTSANTQMSQMSLASHCTLHVIGSHSISLNQAMNIYDDTLFLIIFSRGRLIEGFF